MMAKYHRRSSPPPSSSLVTHCERFSGFGAANHMRAAGACYILLAAAWFPPQSGSTTGTHPLAPIANIGPDSNGLSSAREGSRLVHITGTLRDMTDLVTTPDRRCHHHWDQLPTKLWSAEWVLDSTARVWPQLENIGSLVISFCQY